jgi:hypothetical protein
MIVIHEGTHLELKAGPGWGWKGFDGRIALRASTDRIRLEGKPAIVEGDLRTAILEAIGKAYGATGFDDVPGVVLQAVLEIDEATLCSRCGIGGQKTVNTHTTGQFKVVVQPSLKAATPPIPDPVVDHNGTWSIARPEVRRMHVEEGGAA